MLQIFIRPREAHLPGSVGFFDRHATVADAQWQWLGAEGSEAPLKIRQHVRVYDARVSGGQSLPVPIAPGMTPWLYVIEGDVRVGRARLRKGDAITNLAATLPGIHADSPATLVLLLVDLAAPASQRGTISGR